jgi:hypothetical protein
VDLPFGLQSAIGLPKSNAAPAKHRCAGAARSNYPVAPSLTALLPVGYSCWKYLPKLGGEEPAHVLGRLNSRANHLLDDSPAPVGV